MKSLILLGLTVSSAFVSYWKPCILDHIFDPISIKLKLKLLLFEYRPSIALWKTIWDRFRWDCTDATATVSQTSPSPSKADSWRRPHHLQIVIPPMTTPLRNHQASTQSTTIWSIPRIGEHSLSVSYQPSSTTIRPSENASTQLLISLDSTTSSQQTLRTYSKLSISSHSSSTPQPDSSDLTSLFTSKFLQNFDRHKPF